MIFVFLPISLFFSIIFIMADPITHPSEMLLRALTCLELSIPKPTSIGNLVFFFILETACFTSVIEGFLYQLSPL